MKKIAIIFAGGTGQRMGSDIPKQFMKVQGREIIIHTLEKFEVNDNIDQIVVACIEDWIPELEKLLQRYDIDKVVSVIPGGATGQDTIYLALEEARRVNANEEEDPIVLIHDGVRPLITQETINKCVDGVIDYGSAITSTACFETPLLSVDGQTVENMPPRRAVYTAQAPQCFYLNDILEAHHQVRKTNPEYKDIVDSCGLMFSLGKKCHLIEGNRGNIKVTTPEDYITLLGNLQAEDFRQFYELEATRKKKLANERGIPYRMKK